MQIPPTDPTPARSAALRLDQYDTDKVQHGSLPWYDQQFAAFVARPVFLLELGIHKGGSLLLWRDYFPDGRIVGIDREPLPDIVNGQDRISPHRGSQIDRDFLSRVARETTPTGEFDIVIDDASHRGWMSRISFWHLFDNHLKPGGLYVIEDWGTGYWQDWSDGRAFRDRSKLGDAWRRLRTKARLAKVRWPSHDFGMVGFIKELIDEQGAEARERRLTLGPAGRSSKFESIVVTESIVFVRKAVTA